MSHVPSAAEETSSEALRPPTSERGLGLLRSELHREQERWLARELEGSDAERARAAAMHAARSAELEQRIGSAQLVDVSAQRRDEGRFGASVRLRSEAGTERRYRIVGVDEADAAQGAI